MKHEDHAGTSAPPSDRWLTAGDLADNWLKFDDSSFESALLTSHARALLQSMIFEFELTSMDYATALGMCRNQLKAEVSSPGVVIEVLSSSTDARIRSVAQDVTTIGAPWFTMADARNVVVMTALSNLPG